MKNYIYKFIETIKKDWQKKHFKAAIGKSLFLGIAFLLPLTVIAVAIVMLLLFLAEHFDAILTVLGITLVFIYLIKEHYCEKEKERSQAVEKQNALDEENGKAIIQESYDFLRSALYPILRDLYPILKLKQPQDETELDSPNRYVRRGNFIVYQFIAYSTTDQDNAASIKNTLQKEFIQRLKLKMLDGFAESKLLYNGAAYPAIIVDSVDLHGVYYTISLVLTNKDYLDCRTRGISTSLLNQAKQLRIPHDKDF